MPWIVAVAVYLLPRHRRLGSTPTPRMDPQTRRDSVAVWDLYVLKRDGPLELMNLDRACSAHAFEPRAQLENVLVLALQ